MSEWKAKRFWKTATTAPVEGGWQVLLDARPVRTPAKALLVLPTEALAQAVAEEWDRQEERIDPGAMPVTRTANSAIDKVGPQRAAVAGMLAAYGGSDLLCYRAEMPAELAARQTAEWDPLLDWVAEAHGARLKLAAGVMPVEQAQDDLARLSAPVEALDPFRLAAFHDLVALSGSLVLALAVVEDRLAPEEAWRLSRLDEDWQIEQWGEDEEAQAMAAVKRAAFLDAARFWNLLAAR
ncbi:ATP12 family chaperone protein [Limimaricola pyoseonensis]|uniref:Chaperone required for the assembly of the F1-ATPase n=1 Tax=Limimaricola pyoseonensis TaxID=521013 RepID=A0A1G7KY00_9RHOB|nr:ATP12 family protein [Limimaricola pyoseonensis]SDF42073.1 Chaperone required for the assembly of the F1-ATPase [Limimaricola pyoseonensis]